MGQFEILSFVPGAELGGGFAQVNLFTHWALAVKVLESVRTSQPKGFDSKRDIVKWRQSLQGGSFFCILRTYC